VAAASLLGQALQSRALAAVLFGAFAVDVICSKGGAGWHDEPGNGLPWGAVALGLGAGAGAVLAAVLVGLGAGLAGFHRAPVDLLGLALAAAQALATAARDEPLWRWLPRRMFVSSMGPRGARLFSLALGLAAATGAGASAGSSLLLALAQGLLGNALLTRTGSLAAAIGASAGLHFACALAASTLEARWVRGSITPPALATGPGALLIAAALALAALVVWRAPRRPSAPGADPEARRKRA
jgi:hypothetical protein